MAIGGRSVIGHFEQFVREDLPEATVIRVRVRSVPGFEVDQIRAEFARLIEEGKDRFILDLTDVRFPSSAFLGMLVTLRRKWMARRKTSQPQCLPMGFFAFYEDKEEAIGAIRRGETEPLLLCGVIPDLRDVFIICRLSPG